LSAIDLVRAGDVSDYGRNFEAEQERP
jgi:hypothetical protein